MADFLKGKAYYSEKDCSYYDANVQVTSCNVMDFRDSPYAELHATTVDLIEKYGCKHVLEIGCGTGVFAERLFDCGEFQYSGFDFSEERLKIAKKRVPSYDFFCDDVYKTTAYQEKKYDVVICHEVLEHLKNDFYPLKKISSGARVIFSVPTFDSEAHVRFFDSQKSVFSRYSRFIKINEIIIINNIYLVDGVMP